MDKDDAQVTDLQSHIDEQKNLLFTATRMKAADNSDSGEQA